MTESIDTLVLLPRPRTLRAHAGYCAPGAACEVVCIGDPQQLLPIAEEVQRSIREYRGFDGPIRAAQPGAVPVGGFIICLDPSQQEAAQSYKLTIRSDGIEISASDAAGAFYGAMTLRQILRQCEHAIPAGDIVDAPDFVVRGVMLDVSRDKVPTMQTLYELVDQLAQWKINHLELYTEHTFAYREHPDVWAQSSPMTGEQVMRLDAYARRRFIELVPNQNCFGHFHRWLDVPRYRDLAESPDGFDFPWGAHRAGPYSLDPTNPKSLEHVAEMLDELLPHFTSRKLNVGCDEVWDLGLGKSGAECDKRGRERVYLDFLLKIHKLVSARGHTMHFWNDIVIQKPQLLKELPGDVVALEWGYEVGDPFEEHAEILADAGVRFYVCPGTSSWRSFIGRTDNCLTNICDAATHGHKHGAEGLLVTEWGDQGYWQYLPFSYLGLGAAASISWCRAGHAQQDFVAALDLHVFHDRSRRMGRLVYDLGNAYHCCGKLIFNGTPLFPFLEQPLTAEVPEYLTEQRIEDCLNYVREAAAPLDEVRMQRADAGLIRAEFRNSLRMHDHACARALAIRRGAIETRKTKLSLASDLRRIIGEHQRLWLSRNREGGLHRSTSKLIERLREYEGTHDALL
jgi:hexosaminidase